MWNSVHKVLSLPGGVTRLLLRKEGRTGVCVGRAKWASQAEARQSRGFDGFASKICLQI